MKIILMILNKIYKESKLRLKNINKIIIMNMDGNMWKIMLDVTLTFKIKNNYLMRLNNSLITKQLMIIKLLKLKIN